MSNAIFSHCLYRILRAGRVVTTLNATFQDRPSNRLIQAHTSDVKISRDLIGWATK